MKNIFYKIFIVIALSLFFTSCVSKDKPVKIRIVSLDGKYNPIVTRTPELNAKILASPENLNEEKTRIIENSKKEIKRPIVKKDPEQKEVAQNQQNSENTPHLEDAPLVAVEAEKVEDNKPKSVQQILANKEAVAEYDLSEEEVKKTSIIKKPVFIKNSKGKKGAAVLLNSETTNNSKIVNNAKIAKPKIIKKKGLFVQVGSFSDVENANKSLHEMKKFYKGFIDVSEGEKTIYRVLLGPFSNKVKANSVMSKIKTSGHEAIIVRNR